jgi:hypothetical protein
MIIHKCYQLEPTALDELVEVLYALLEDESKTEDPSSRPKSQ